MVFYKTFFLESLQRMIKKIAILFIVFFVLAIGLIPISLFLLSRYVPTEEIPVEVVETDNTSEVSEDTNVVPEELLPIEIVDAKAAIEADVYLSGSGTGFHGKLVIQTPTSAVSFGPQYDEAAPEEYRGETAFIIENVESNNPGDQEYTRVGFAELNTWYNLMLSIAEDGSVNAYVDGEIVATVHNSGLSNKNVTLSVEGSARKNGDMIDVTFKDIKLKGSDAYNSKKYWAYNISETNDGIKVTDQDGEIKIQGTIEGLKDEEDWDSAYDQVSGVVQYPIK